jgi:nucleoside-diphosphate-sugar epimerase
VTGATGLIGGCLVEALMLNPQRDYAVYASGRNQERAQERFKSFADDKGFHFIQHDVLKPLQGDVRFDYVIHAASNASPNFFAQKPVEVIKSNIDGVTHLMEYGLDHGMRRFLYVSSGEVYGEGDGRTFTEDYSGYVDCTKSRSCYPSSKRAAETLCVSYAAEYGADVVIARPCHIYGPYFTEQDNRVYAQFIRNVLCGENIIMKSTGEQFRSWCYVVDCVSALLHILLKGESGEAYNIADASSNISIRELAEPIASIGGCKVVIDVPDAEEKKGYNVVTKSVFDTGKISKLGWMPRTTIEDGIRHIIFENSN